MSTAVVKLHKGFKDKKVYAPGQVRIKKLAVSKNNVSKRFSVSAILLHASGVVLLVLAVLAVSFYYFYSNALATVDQRVKIGFWQTRSGLYAAPHVLRTGQKITIEELVTDLRHSGYVEGEARNIWSGNFSVQGDTVSIQTNQTGNEKPETVSLKILNGKIEKITDAEGTLDSYKLQPEMISGNTEAKRASVNSLKFEQIPENLRNAIIFTEDRRFFEHNGLDFRGIFRAMLRNVSDGSLTQGGSTITQQFVKNIFLTREKTFSRKFYEAFLALALEKRLSKEEIFALYCNEIYLGQYGANAVHGVEQASRMYFGKEINDLDLAEAATLAAMVKSPNYYAPHRNAQASVERRNLIIQSMEEAGLVSPVEAEKAQTEKVALIPPKKIDTSLAPYFVDNVTKQIAEKNLPEGKNLRVYTTVDTQLQEMAETAVKTELAKLDKTFSKKGLTPQAALVAMDPQNGHILAMVGGRDYAASQLNRATESRRQPGSAFKPFVYAAALERGKLPTTLISDRPTAFPLDKKPYQPANYKDSYAMRDITMKTALAKSSNVAAVETALESGLYNVANTAEKFGLPKPPSYPSIALGTSEVTPLELAAAYAVFANLGKKVNPTFISAIVSGEGDSVSEIEPKDSTVISPQTAYMMTDMLGAVVENGTARAAKDALGNDVAFVGKTGSTKDGWFVGYTPNLVCVVWVGFDEGDKDIGFTGGEIALPIWTDFMRQATQNRPEFGGKYFPMPKGLIQVTIDPETGMVADKFCPQKQKVVIPTNAFSNIICLRHQPKPDMLQAQNDYEESVATISAENYDFPNEETEQNNSDDSKNYKSINGVPVMIEDKPVKSYPEKTTEDLPERKKSNFERDLNKLIESHKVGSGVEN